ncbi:MAG: GNAT family N-acetyltransferase [Paracoccaceae bacterium]
MTTEPQPALRPGMRPEIRLATPEDLPALHAMSQALATHLDEAPRDMFTLHRDAFILPGTRVLVARSAGGAAGYLLMRLTRDPITRSAGYEIAALFVAPAHRRHGIGRRLIGAARLLAEAEGRATLSMARPMARLIPAMGAARALPLALA